jgi:uncharacterized protein YjaG (DUF416 family)
LQHDFEQMKSKLETDKADLERQLSLATARYEESENQRGLAESKLKELDRLHENLDLQYSNLQTSHDALTAKLELTETMASATIGRAATMESQVSKRQVIGSCG